MLVRLTNDQLVALAAGLGVDGFPGAASALLDRLPPQERTSVATALLDTLEAVGLLVHDTGQVVVDPDLAMLLLPLLEGDAWVVERTEDERRTTTLVAQLDGVVVVHSANGSMHTLERADDLIAVLLDLIDASDEEPQATRPLQHRRSGLLDRPTLRPTVESWRATTTLQRLSAPGVVEKVGVIDGGPGRVWWITLDPDADDALEDDPTLLAVPAGAGALGTLLMHWAAAPVH